MSSGRIRVVVLGGGFGGAYCARTLARRLGSRAEILLIDRNNYFVFYPLLIEAGIGSLEPRHVVVPIRAFLPGGGFRMGEALGIDHAARELAYRPAGGGDVRRERFDHLVVAVGSVTKIPDIPGLRRHAYTVKGLRDAVALRDRAVTCLETADGVDDRERRRSLLGFVVVGGSFTGVEIAGEYHEYLHDGARRYPRLDPDDCRVTVVDHGERLLPALDEGLADYARRKLADRGVDVRLGVGVDSVEHDRVVLGDGSSVPAETVIWCAGIAPHPVVAKLDLPVDDGGWIRSRPDLSVEDRDGVWAIGDAARNPDPDGNAYPATAQHAVRQGAHAAENIARVAAGDEPTRFAYRSAGSLAALGCRTGVASVLGVRLTGFAAWWMFRTVYLAKMPGVARRMRVALDWTTGLFAGTDYVQLGVHGPRGDDRGPG